MSKRFLIIAAEASSVLYADQLIKHWKNEKKNHSYFGIASKKMESEGFQCFGYAEDMAVMGFTEVIKHYNKIKNVYNKIIQEIENNKPDIALLIDYPGFNLKLSKELHQRNIPVVYYISPQIWAWKKDRIKIIKSYVTKMLVVFPFEEEFYKEHSVDVEYVGHPLIDELKPELFDVELIEKRRHRLNINDKQKVLGLMPGSRIQEIERHLAIQLQTAEILQKENSELKVLLLVAPTLSKEYIQNQLGQLNVPITLVQDEPFNMICLTDAILAASGTATLMVGLLQVPMVIMYRMNWITAFVGRKIVKGFFGLVNILAKREVVPELFQGQAEPKRLAVLLKKSLYDDIYRHQVKKDLTDLRNLFGPGGVTVRVAKSIESVLERGQKNV